MSVEKPTWSPELLLLTIIVISPRKGSAPPWGFLCADLSTVVQSTDDRVQSTDDRGGWGPVSSFRFQVSRAIHFVPLR